MSEFSIFALKTHADWAERVYNSLKSGEGRYGWSWNEDANLHSIKSNIETSGWTSLTPDLTECYQPFLLYIKPLDYVVYLNVPTYGRCTLARVTKPYFWDFRDDDFNHRVGVDPSSVRDFARDAEIVHPHLQARLKLQGRWWRIYCVDEFQQLLNALNEGQDEIPDSPIHRAQLLAKEIQPFLLQITNQVHHTHPSFALEELIASVLQFVPTVKKVIRCRGKGDFGADIILETEQIHPITSEILQRTILVQVKSYEGDHWDTKAVDDLRRAFQEYPDSEEGLIVSTALQSTPQLDQAIEDLRNESNKEIYLLLGSDLAAFLVKYGWQMLRP